MHPLIPREIVPSAQPAELSPRSVAAEFRRRMDQGMPIRPAGEARNAPESLLARGYTPRYKVSLFDTEYYLAHVRQNEDIRFFVAYVVQAAPGRRKPVAFPRIFYKDVSLVWRSASHFIRSEEENWIGKGDLELRIEDGEELRFSKEETTDLPLEIQSALEELSRRPGRIYRDEVAVSLVLRRGGNDRIAPFRDFSEPRRRAEENPRNRVNGGRRVAWFSRKGDPRSLRFVAGYEPDFGRGILEESSSGSKLYGGRLHRFRILSRNRRIQYQFMAGAHHVWIIPPQATTTEIMSYGVRTVDVPADEELCVPGFEYHFLDDSTDPPEFVSQIPEGYAGAVSATDASRCDASAWLDELPVVREFRRKVLRRRK